MKAFIDTIKAIVEYERWRRTCNRIFKGAIHSRTTAHANSAIINNYTYNLHLDYKNKPIDDEYNRRMAEIEEMIRAQKAGGGRR